MTGTYNDWDPNNVDLLSLDQIACRSGLSLPELKKIVSLDSKFPASREVDGCRRWRQWQVDLFFDGAYFDEKSQPESLTRAA